MRYSNERELVMDRVRYAMMKREGCNEGDEKNFNPSVRPFVRSTRSILSFYHNPINCIKALRIKSHYRPLKIHERMYIPNKRRVG